MERIIYNESPDERTERFMRLVEAEERRRQRKNTEPKEESMNQEAKNDKEV